MSTDNAETKKVKRRVKRNEDGKLEVKVGARIANLSQPKKLDEDWREKMRQKIIKASKDKRKSGKRGSLGYFTSQSSTLVGDPYMDSSKREQKWQRGNGSMIRGITARPKKSFNKHSSFTHGDPYIDPGKRARMWQKEQEKKRLPGHGAFKGGASKLSQSIHKTFTPTRFQAIIDADEEEGALAKKIKEELSKRRTNKKKFTNFRKPNMRSAAPKQGGYGVKDVLLPVYDKKLRKNTKYIESPYEKTELLQTAARKAHEATLTRLHSGKRFAGLVRKNPTFMKDSEAYGLGEDESGKPIVRPLYDPVGRAEPLKSKTGELLPPWKPPQPAKNGKYADKRLYFQKHPEHMSDGYRGSQVSRPNSQHATRVASLHDKPWNPNGTHTYNGKGTRSVIDNSIRLKQNVFAVTR